MKKKIVHIVLNTFEYDTRIIKECKTLSEEGYEVIVIAYWNDGLQIKEEVNGYQIIRLLLITKPWNKHPIIQCIKYIEFLLKSLLIIKRIKPDICHGHDPDGLFVGYMAKLLWGINLIYDSHELWGHTKHMTSYNRILYKIGSIIEKRIMKRANAIITVNESIASIMKKNNIKDDIFVIRNIPEVSEPNSEYTRGYYQFPESKYIIISVGSISRGRGVEQLIRSMENVSHNIGLVLLGGEKIYKERILNMIEKYNLEDRIELIDPVSPDEVINVCRLADVGIVATENISLNDYYSLPNKIFQYIHAGLPVLCSNLPEMEKIIDDYHVGLTLDMTIDGNMSNMINSIFANKNTLKKFTQASTRASEKLSWNNEKNILLNVYKQLN